LCAQRFIGLAGEGDLIRVWSHGDYASESVVDAAASVPGGGVCVVTRCRVIWGLMR
jgi:hypothetical protein